MIFALFYTTKEVGKVTGLGLSTVYLTLTFKLSRKITPQQTASIGKLNATILICEDDHDVRELTVGSLSNSGLTIHQAEDPKSAIALCKEIGHEID